MLLYVYFFWEKNEKREIRIYAPSEKEARETFKKWWKYEPGELLKRENW